MTDERKGVVFPFQRAEDMKNKIVSIDGYMRSKESEEKMNSLFAAVFQGPAGNAVLDYIESLTLRTVSGPSASSDLLRHNEGMRHLASIILERTRLGRSK
jgi:hypothetical protein